MYITGVDFIVGTVINIISGTGMACQAIERPLQNYNIFYKIKINNNKQQ